MALYTVGPHCTQLSQHRLHGHEGEETRVRTSSLLQRTAHPVLPMNEMKATREMQNSVALLALRRLLSVKAEDKGSFHLRERKDNLGQHVDHIGPPADEKE